MREAIERVLVDLQARQDTCIALGGRERACAYEVAINLLKEVLNTADNNTRNSPESERDGKQEQSQ